MTIKLIASFLISMLFALAFGKYYIPWLKRQHAQQEIKENGPTWHSVKAGTPTMGGVMFILGTLLVILTVGFDGMLKGNYMHLFAFIFALIFGLIGFLDDWEKIKKKQNLGLRAKHKFILQLAAAIVFIILLYETHNISNTLYIPFANKTVTVPLWFYIALSAFITVGCVNSVNITDGIDGLSSGTSIPVMLFFVALTFYAGEEYLELGIFASGMLGGLLGFLYYNFNPAKVFMGDTGSLFVGGAIVALAYGFDMPLILIILAFMFILETLSDIIQVGYYKLSHGKRVFKMAPLHHHLELGGFLGHKWKEKELFVLFTGMSLICAIISFIGIIGKFG